jgi:hypothetical protein
MDSKLNPKLFTPPANLPPGFRIPPSAPLHGDARVLIRLQLNNLDTLLKNKISGSANQETKAHLQDSRNRIHKILFPVK